MPSSSPQRNLPALDPEVEAPPPKLFAEVSMMEHEWGTPVWEDYEKLKLLADSGTGEIWLCQRKNTNYSGSNSSNQYDTPQQTYAIKAIDKNFLSGMFAKELQNEVDVLRQLDHPHIVRIYETYEDRSIIYLVMEYCAYGDLTTKFPQTDEEVAMVLIQVLSAIVYCHQHKVVHRDLKLENIVWASDTTVKLIDFGYAQHYIRQPRGEYTMKMDVGTTYTLSPQVIGGEYSERTDEWGIGVIAYILLTGGKKPFDADKNNQVREEIKRGEYSMHGPEWEGISQQAKDFVKSLLEYNEEHRITAEDALRSPWLMSFQQAVEDIDDNVIASVAEALVTCVQEPKLKRLSMMIIAHDAPEERIEELRTAFDALDSSKDGTITLEEFQSTIKNNSSIALSDAELEGIFHELDMNNTGVISYTDFLSATLESHCEVDVEMVAEAFDKLDVESTGAIEKENIEALLPEITADETNGHKNPVDEILQEVNAPDGKVDFETFSSMFNENGSDSK
jgi:calcium-dependent protein kinase